MAEYIEREALIKAIKVHETAENDRIETGYNWALDDIEEIVKQMPAADVKPVIHAEWILFDKDCCGRAFYCSNCRKVTTTDDFENTPLEREEYFCPRCGADMRETKKG